MGREVVVAVGSGALSILFHGIVGLVLGVDGLRSVLVCSLAAIPAFLLASLLFWDNLQVSIRASLLGSIWSLGILVALPTQSHPWQCFGYYLAVFSFFHWSEYVWTALWGGGTLSTDSFLLNHSVEYWIAAIGSWTEFLVEVYFFPGMKEYGMMSALGVLLCAVGEGIRKGAMVTAGRNFTHLVSYHKQTEHQLITHGVYSIFRHPAYVGWFWWSIGTQIILCNPVCTVAYAAASWTFFKERLWDEELALIRFFGEEYIYYKERVPTGIPFIYGYDPDS